MAAGLLAITAVGFAVLWALAAVFEPRQGAWQVEAPLPAEIEALRGAVDGPVYWLGPTFGGHPVTTARQVDAHRPYFEAAYDERCENLDPGSGPSCEDAGRVETHKRVIGRGLLSEGFSEFGNSRWCWHRAGDVWVHSCPRGGNNALPDHLVWPRLLTGDADVTFWIPKPDESWWSWPRVVKRLERFDEPQATRLPATQRFSCAEYRSLGERARQALPGELRPEQRC